MTPEEAQAFVPRHFEDFGNRQDLSAADRISRVTTRNMAPILPRGSVPGSEAPNSTWRQPSNRFPDIHVTIEDIIAEGDKVVVRNVWRATDCDSQQRIEFGGIVIWRIAGGKLAEHWAYLDSPHPVHCS